LGPFQPPRYEIDDQDTRYRNGSFEKEPICKTRVLIVDRFQMSSRSRSMAISRENSSEKELDVVEDQIFNSREFAEAPTPPHPPPARSVRQYTGTFNLIFAVFYRNPRQRSDLAGDDALSIQDSCFTRARFGRLGGEKRIRGLV
jgi:hypothetical protein